MKKSIIALTIALCSTTVLANQKQVGDDLAFFNDTRAPKQVGAIVADLSGKPTSDIASFMASYEIDTPSEAAIAVAKKAIENNKDIAPKYMALMQEQADIRGISLVEMIAVASTIDLAVNDSIKESMEIAPKGCTTVAFNTGIVGQTNDLPLASLTDNSTVIKTNDYMHLFTDGAFFQGMGKHVGVVLNFLGAPSGDGAQFEDNVVTVDAVFAAITSKKSVDEVISIFDHYRTAIAFNFTVSDDQGNTAAIEVTKDNVNVVRGERGVAHGNHVEATKTDMVAEYGNYEANQKVFYSFAREEVAANFVDYSPELTVGAMQYLFEQRPINMTKYQGKDFVTIETMVFDVKEGCAYVSGDNPRFGEYTKVCF